MLVLHQGLAVDPSVNCVSLFYKYFQSFKVVNFLRPNFHLFLVRKVWKVKNYEGILLAELHLGLNEYFFFIFVWEKWLFERSLDL